MIGTANVAIQNLQGLFIHAWNKGDYACCAALFTGQETDCFEAPDDGIRLPGGEIAPRLAEAACAMGTPFLLSHTPAIRVEREGTARASWYLSTVQESAEGMIQGSARFDASFRRTEAGWRYTYIQIFYMMTLEPENGPGMEVCGFPAGGIELLAPASRETSPADFLALQRMLGRWSHDRRAGALNAFSRAEDVLLSYSPLLEEPCRGIAQVKEGLERLEELERQTGPIPLTIPMLTTPWIETCEEQARGSWLVISHDHQAGEDEKELVAHRVAQLLVNWVREGEEWKIRSLVMKPLFSLPFSEILTAGSADTILNMEGAWLNAPAPTGRGDEQSNEDALLLEEYVAFWVSGLRYRSEAPFYYHRLAIDYPELLSYRLGCRPTKRGLQEVTDEIFAMTSKFSTLQPKSPGNHTGTTPVIEISPDGSRAVAVWLDYGWTTQAEVFGITEPPYFANPAVARYEHHYLKTPEGWKLYGFHWAPFYRLGKWRFDYATTKGWSGTTSTKRFPLPLEQYHYEDDEAKRGLPVVLDPPMIDCPYERPWTGETDKL